MNNIAIVIVVGVIVSMCAGDPARNIKNPVVNTAISVLDQTSRIWGWYKFPIDAMAPPDNTGKIVQTVINELGKKVNVSFIPTLHAKEANLNSAADVSLYNEKLMEMEAECRDELFSKENDEIVNDVEMHLFISNCLRRKGLSENELSYEKIYKYFNTKT